MKFAETMAVRAVAVVRGNRALPAVFSLAALLMAASADMNAEPATAATNSAPGLMVTFTASEAGRGADVVIAPNVWLYVPEGTPPTPFLAAGRFSAVWEGELKSPEQDGPCDFEAELNGSVRVEINGTTVLEAITNGVSLAPKPAALNRGANVLKVRFTCPERGDAYLRLFWRPKGAFLQPIPLDLLTHAEGSPDAAKSAAAHLGRELFLEYRCAKCHATPDAGTGAPELGMDAPSFEGIGSRRNYEWMSRWILDPKASRPTARMPKLLRGASAAQDAMAIAAYLASLKETASPSNGGTVDAAGASVDSGRALFETLHCGACHSAPDAEAEAGKIALGQAGEKFAPGDLARYLRAPDAHYRWTRMPDFKLSADEAAQLAAWLAGPHGKPGVAAPADAATIERGKGLVQTSGCLNCHELKLRNEFTAPSLAALPAANWDRGCPGGGGDSGTAQSPRSPEYAFNAVERAALRAFAGTDRASLGRHVLPEFAGRQTRLMNCRQCHGTIENVPAFDILGGKLKPEWSSEFIAGAITNRLRPWLDARMPAFHNRAADIAQGLAMFNGWPPRTPPEPPIDMEQARIGQKLVSMAGGFSCVTCHAVGNVPSQLFESAGINFAFTGSRLLKPYAQRWMRGPQSIDPSTKMPLYWDDEGKSALTDIYDGDSARQIDAIWEYLRLGDKIPPPPTP